MIADVSASECPVKISQVVSEITVSRNKHTDKKMHFVISMYLVIHLVDYNCDFGIMNRYLNFIYLFSLGITDWHNKAMFRSVTLLFMFLDERYQPALYDCINQVIV